MISSNNDSSQGIANGPTLENPYSSSASARSRRKIGWFRSFARTTYLRRFSPTEMATWPGGTSETGSLLDPMWAFFCHCFTIWRIRTTLPILLFFPISQATDLLLWKMLRRRRERKKKVKDKTFLGVAFSSFCDSFGKQRNVEGERVIFKGQLGFLKWSLIFV